MNILHFKPSVIAVVAGLLALSFNHSVQASENRSAEDYAWAQTLKEAIEPVPHIQDSLTEDTDSRETESKRQETREPWGQPKSFLDPISEPSESEEAIEGFIINDEDADNEVDIPVEDDDLPDDNELQDDLTVSGDAITARETVMEPIKEGRQRSRLEELYSGEFQRKAERNLKQIGYAVFQNVVSELESTSAAPQSYIIGPGDEIILTLSGSFEAFHRLVVDRDGIISIPEFGALPVTGTRYGDLRQTVHRFLKERRHGFELTVSLGSLRTIQIKVIGRVGNPGLIELPALSNVITALSAAGGVVKDGSLRRVILSRPGSHEVIDIPIDLYDYLRHPDKPARFPQIQDGDTIFIPSIGATVGISGLCSGTGHL